MSIVHATAHHLSRTTDTQAALQLHSGGLPIDAQCQQLLDRLKNGFLSRMSREHGSFASDGEPAPLPRLLESLLNNETDLDQLASEWMTQLSAAVDEQRCELDAHFLFFLEKSFDSRVCYLFITQQVESLTLDSELNIQTSRAFDFGASLFGIKVDLTEWKERGHYAYLSLIPPRGNPSLGDLFYRFTGFANGINKGEATLTFLKGIEAYSHAIPEEKVNDYRTQVVNYCVEQDERDAPIDIRELSENLDGVDCDEFVKVMASHNPKGEEPVMIDRTSLRRYVKFAGRERDLAISFSSFQLNDRVHYDAEHDTLSIKGIPKALRNQLLGHLKEG